MKEKINEFVKSRIFIFILGGLLFGTIGVSAATYFPSNDVTYDNSESGLESTNVQEAIDELYNSCESCNSSGSNIYYISSNTGYKGIYKMSINGGKATKIPVSGSQLEANIYNDAKQIFIYEDYIYFSSLNRGIYKISINGGKPTKIPVSGSQENGNIVAQAEKIIIINGYIYFNTSYTNGIYKMSINGGKPEYISNNASSQSDIEAYSNINDFIIY